MYTEIFDWNDLGYQPLVINSNWQVAKLNWESSFDIRNFHEMERHNHTDEVFILLKGRAILLTRYNQGEIFIQEMKTGIVFNVKEGIWHNLLSTRDASWIIIENPNTHLNDTEILAVNDRELIQIKSKLPEWATNLDDTRSI